MKLNLKEEVNTTCEKCSKEVFIIISFSNLLICEECSIPLIDEFFKKVLDK